MAKKKPETDSDEGRAPDLGLEGNGVAPLTILEIDKAINKYERKKEARCKMSPDEISAKKALTEVMHTNRGKLPLNEEGCPFYRYESVDYVLSEKLLRQKVDDGTDE